MSDKHSSNAALFKLDSIYVSVRPITLYILINLRFAEKVKGHKEIYLTLLKKKRNHYLNKAINHQTVNEWVSLNHTRKLVMSFVFNLLAYNASWTRDKFPTCKHIHF